MSARQLTLGGALLTTGLYAGLYFAFAVAVMPGLARTSDRVFVETMQEINRAILNPVFLLVFLGAPALAIAAAATGAGETRAWLIAAVALHVVTFLITVGANVPLNDALDTARSAAPAREAFEHGWVLWNVARTLTTTGALGCLVAAAVA